MSEQAGITPLRIALVGSTGLIGRAIIRLSVGRADMRLVAIARREIKLPNGAQMEMFVADPASWGDVFADIRPDVLISALGTTMNKAGGDETAFRAVDHDIVVDTARAAQTNGVDRMITVSSVGAQERSGNFYLRVKGEAERDLAKVGFRRLDILRPGLLRGDRDGDLRPAEKLGMIASPLTDRLLQGGWRKYRSMRDVDMARAALALAFRKAGGTFVHEHDALMRAANNLPIPQER